MGKSRGEGRGNGGRRGSVGCRRGEGHRCFDDRRRLLRGLVEVDVGGFDGLGERLQQPGWARAVVRRETQCGRDHPKQSAICGSLSALSGVPSGLAFTCLTPWKGP